MTEDNIPVTDQKNSYHCIYCPDTLKTYPRQTNCLNFHEIRIRKSRQSCSGLLQWLHCIHKIRKSRQKIEMHV